MKLAKGVTGNPLGRGVSKSLGAQHILPRGGKAERKRKRQAATGGPRGSSSAQREKERKGDSYKEDILNRNDSGSASSSESGEEEDELQFVSGAGAEREGHQSGSDGSGTEKEVEATFELFDPREEDAAGLLLLLRHSKVYAQLALQPQQLRELARTIGGQGNIGSVARAAEGAEGRSEAIVGLYTLISVRQYSEVTEPIRSKLLHFAQAHASNAAQAELQRLLAPTEGTRTSTAAKDGAGRGRPLEKINACLFISCRFTNLPLEVAAEATAALAEDVRWSLETPEMDEDERAWYRFSHVIGVALVYRHADDEETLEKQRENLGLGFTPTFAELEHEVLSEGASVAFAVPTNQKVRFSVLPNDFNSKKRDARKRVSVVQSLKEYVLVYALPYDRFERNQRQVKQRLAVQAAMRGA